MSFEQDYYAENASGYELAMLGIDHPRRTAFIRKVEDELQQEKNHE
jgi:hypothetical protein